tara:strand:- start:1980 stop:3935 length:1956 start_codon:yes stop_codon:yes gene_type:complete
MNNTIFQEAENFIKAKKFREALIHINTNKSKISNKDFFYLSAVSYRYLDEPKNALFSLDKLIQIAPEYGRAYQEFGHIHFKLDDKKMSLKSYVRAVRHNPSLHASWLGILAHEDQNINESLIDHAQKNVIYLKNLEPELKSVLSFIHEGKLAKADSLCRNFLIEHPHHVEGMRLLAKIGTDLYIYDDAEFLLESSMLFDPDNIQVKFDYIAILIKRQKYGEALKHARNLYESNQDNPNAKKILATALFRTDSYKESLELYDSVLKIEPNNTDILLSKGHLYKTSGDIPKAIKSYQDSYKKDKYFGDAYWSLANLKTYKFTDIEVSNLLSMIDDKNLSDKEKVFMHFSLGKAFEDIEDYDLSFKHYKAGNDYKKNQSLFNLKDYIEECDNQKSVCTSDLLNTKKDWGFKSSDPIFILGLPRAGSTLIEQILASHSMVEGTHELPNVISTAHKLNQRRAQDINSKYPDILLAMSQPELEAIGKKYIEDAQVFRTDKDYFIDKMPNNFRHIGLIKLTLPNAKIIDIRRSSMSACFSCYKQLFAEGQEFTYNFEDLATYYNEYIDLMNHWNKVLPGSILSINYEDVVNDIDTSVRKILNYCNLPFEQNCIEFYKTKRSVKTPSAEQVRQPIYKSGIDYWKNYEIYLDDLKAQLRY